MRSAALVQTPYHLLQAMADRCRHPDDSVAVFVLRPRAAASALADSLAAAAVRSGLFERVDVVPQPPPGDLADLACTLAGRSAARARRVIREAAPDLAAFDRFLVFQTLSGLANRVVLARWPGRRLALFEDGALHYLTPRRRPSPRVADVLRWIRSRAGAVNDHADPFLLPLPPFDEVRASDPARFDAAHAGEGHPQAMPLWLDEGPGAARFRASVAEAFRFDARRLDGALLVLGSPFEDFGLDPADLREGAARALAAFRRSLPPGPAQAPVAYKPHPRETAPMLPFDGEPLAGAVPVEALCLACPDGVRPAAVLSLHPSTALSALRAAFPDVPAATVRFEGTGCPRYERSWTAAAALLDGVARIQAPARPRKGGEQDA